MARITGKSAKILAQNSRTTVSVALTLTDVGAHTVYQFIGAGAVSQNYIDPTITPTIKVGGVVTTTGFTIQYAGDTVATVTFAASQGASVITAVDYVYSTVTEIGSMDAWAIDAKLDEVDVTAFQDVWKNFLGTFLSWEGTAEGYYISSFWWDLFLASQATYVVFYPVSSASERWFGAVFLNFGLKVTKDAAVKQAIKFRGTGTLTHVA